MNIIRNYFLHPYVTGADFKRDLWGSLAAASADQVNGIINYFSNEHANETNLQLARETNEMNMQIARENNELQERMNKENNDFAANEAQRAFDREKQWYEAWNDPSAQVARLRGAGLNPALAYGNGGSQTGTLTSPAASPHGSGITPSMPNLVTPHYEAFQFKDPSESVKAFAEAFQALGQAKKLGVETDTLEKEQQDLLRMVHAKGDMADLENELSHRFAEKERSVQFKQMTLNLGKETQTLLNLIREGAKIDAETELTRIKQQTEKETAGLKGAERAIAEKDNENYFKLFEAKVDNLLSSTGYNRAAAYNQQQQGLSTAEDVHSKNRENFILDSYNVTKDGVNPLMEWTKSRLEQAAHENALMDWQKERIEQLLPHLVQQAENAAKVGKPWTRDYFLHRLLGPVASSASDFAEEAAIYKYLR